MASAGAGAAEFDHQVKLLLIGDSAVGKTSILLRYVDSRFSSTFITTIGIDVSAPQSLLTVAAPLVIQPRGSADTRAPLRAAALHLPPPPTRRCCACQFKFKTLKIGEQRVKLQIWDTAGQERFHTITTSYFRGAKAVALVYDCTSRASFENIEGWAGQIKEHAGNIVRILVGNKCDKSKDVVVSEDEGRALAMRHKMQFFPTSAKSGYNVDEMFTACAEEVLKTESARRKSGSGLDLGAGGGGRSGCAC